MEEAEIFSRGSARRGGSGASKRDAFRKASKIMLERARNNPKIEFVMNTAVDEVFDVSAEHCHRCATAQPGDRRGV